MYPQLWSTFHAKPRWQCLHQLLLEGSFTGLHGVQPDFCRCEVTTEWSEDGQYFAAASGHYLLWHPPLKKWKECLVRESEHKTPCSWSHDHAYPVSALLATLEQTVQGSCFVLFPFVYLWLSICKWPDPQPNFQVQVWAFPFLINCWLIIQRTASFLEWRVSCHKPGMQ